jgi:hypothetical protein
MSINGGGTPAPTFRRCFKNTKSRPGIGSAFVIVGVVAALVQGFGVVDVFFNFWYKYWILRRGLL